MNLYRYVQNNPVDETDPGGLAETGHAGERVLRFMEGWTFGGVFGGYLRASAPLTEDEAVGLRGMKGVERDVNATPSMQFLHRAKSKLDSNRANIINPLSEGFMLWLPVAGCYAVLDAVPAGFRGAYKESRTAFLEKAESSDSIAVKSVAYAGWGMTFAGEASTESAYLLTLSAPAAPIAGTPEVSALLAKPGVQKTLVWGGTGGTTVNLGYHLYKGDAEVKDFVYLGFAGYTHWRTPGALPGLRGGTTATTSLADDVPEFGTFTRVKYDGDRVYALHPGTGEWRLMSEGKPVGLLVETAESELPQTGELSIGKRFRIVDRAAKTGEHAAKSVAPKIRPRGSRPTNAHKWNDLELQSAVDQIHVAEFGAGKGKGIPISVTATKNGRVVVSQVGKKPGPKARAKARELFGGDVEFVKGTTGGNAPGVRGHDAEARAIEYLGADAQGARQATTHYACPHCEVRQVNAGVTNVTGTQSQQGTITRPFIEE